LVIRPVNKTLKAEVQGQKVLLRAGAGCVWDQTVRYTVYRSWWGLENLAGIPGSVGGAVVQNMGAYGMEIQECIVEVTAIRKTDGQRVVFKREECAYGYRTSLFKKKDSPYIVWEVLLELSEDRGPRLSYDALAARWQGQAPAEITPGDMMREVLRMRKQKLPDPKVLGSAGSFFANPVVSALHYERLKAEYADLPGHSVGQDVKIPAARLIEQCGWKGYREGDAGVYENQPLVLVNYGLASGGEIWELACRIRDSVEKKFHIRLQTEVCVYGTEEDKLQMHYQEVLDKMFHSLPMFQRIGAAAYKADLSNTKKMMEVLNHPHRRFKSVHVAGTNGKGSCSHLLAAVFQAAGYKTGLYTSPHLNDFRERIRVNGEMISKERVIAFYETNADLFDRIKASFFEMTVAMAFDHFARERVEIAIIEVGMGGRLDSTNVITPDLSVITNISPDHMQFLGDTLSKIAEEKAGIIKPGIPVVIGETQVQTLPVFQKKAAKNGCPIVFADELFSVRLKGETSEGLLVDVTRQGS
ncbi:MAG: UDP-N-acetylmuramate dehydrogenase, partial [Bacteroidales bacterium]|nr:UDP-N-acetylmuramate dehydrogenase [Bacteroidales bacterium]